jgi:hypothetical protein
MLFAVIMTCCFNLLMQKYTLFLNYANFFQKRFKKSVIFIESHSNCICCSYITIFLNLLISHSTQAISTP